MNAVYSTTPHDTHTSPVQVVSSCSKQLPPAGVSDAADDVMSQKKTKKKKRMFERYIWESLLVLRGKKLL